MFKYIDQRMKTLSLFLFIITSLILTNNSISTPAYNYKYGYIDESGKIVIEIQYDLAYPFRNNMAAVYKDGKWGWID